MFGIQCCTDPTCARAYPHSLEEHDAKSEALCPACQHGFDTKLRRKKAVASNIQDVRLNASVLRNSPNWFWPAMVTGTIVGVIIMIVAFCSVFYRTSPRRQA